MTTVNMHEAKTHLSRYIDAVENGIETEVIIARNGKPAARLVPIAKAQNIIWGLAKDKYYIPDIDEELDLEIEKLFYGEID